MKNIIGTVAILAIILFHPQPLSKRYLKIMTYPSFLSPYGPGFEIKQKFENICKCEIRWIKVEDSTLMVQRLKLRSDGMGIDVVLGLDQITLYSAHKEWKWRKISVPTQNFIPIAQKWTYYQNDSIKAVPISWSPLSFISRENNTWPKDLLSLVQQNQWKISIPDPRYSTLGLQFYFWIFSVFEKEEKISKFLNQLKNQIYSISHSWSSSYGLFQKKFANVTFTYQTSWVYHFIEENKKYSFFTFQEGHPYQMEYVAIPETCRQCLLAQKFIQFLLKKNSQQILMNKNYMLPVIQGVKENSPFKHLSEWPIISYEKIDMFLSEKKKWLKIWEDIFN